MADLAFKARYGEVVGLQSVSQGIQGQGWVCQRLQGINQDMDKIAFKPKGDCR